MTFTSPSYQQDDEPHELVVERVFTIAQYVIESPEFHRVAQLCKQPIEKHRIKNAMYSVSQSESE